MFCPECKGEFRDEIQRCPDCSVDLVAELPVEEHDLSEFQSVFETTHPAVLPVVRSLLNETDIPYSIKGEETLGLFPGTGMGLLIDPKSRAAQVLVPAAHAEEARELLSEIDNDPEIEDEQSSA